MRWGCPHVDEDRSPPHSPVAGLYTPPSLTSTLLKRTTPPSLGKGFWVRPAEKDTRAGSGTPRAERGKSAWTRLSAESVDVDWGTSYAKGPESPLVRPTASTEKLNGQG